MYPYIEIFGFKLYMTWVWIVCFIISNIFLVKFYCKKYWLNFRKYFNWIPLFLILPYILWSYSYYVIERFFIIPWNINDFLMILTSYWYKFNFIWISLGIWIVFYLFLKTINLKPEKLKRIDILFYSMALWIVPMWIFLLLWDNFIWVPSKSLIAISAFMEDSQIYKLWKVAPLWLLLSMIWITSFISTFMAHYILKKHWVWIIWFIILLLLFNFIFIYAQYPKHLVINLLGTTFDIKNYWTFILSWLIILYYRKLNLN